MDWRYNNIRLQMQAFYSIIVSGRKVISVANTTAVYARINTNLKENAEGILAKLGITPSAAIQMLYSQIVLQNGMPFDLRIPTARPVAAGSLTRAELDAELMKGFESLKAGEVISADDVEAALNKEFGI